MTKPQSALGCLLLSVIAPVVVIGVLIGLSFLINIGRFQTPDPDPEDLAHAKPGDCIIGSTEGGQQSRWGSCDDPGAEKKIIAITKHQCIDLPGVDMSLRADRTYCLGDKNNDPSTTVNGIVAGECTNAGGNGRQSCDSPGHRRVLAVLENEVAMDQPTNSDPAAQLIGGGAIAACRQAGVQADRVYSFSLVTVGTPPPGQPNFTRTHHDRSLCLSEVR
ncbi:hypothetical protein [Granulicoccus sp. GXG6511]|uniref:hypothetical protein n=1 Tax=Granulicoccus sp. GXG6511 TaxID=3381351 RepID=UPI003D7E3FE8